MDAKLLLDERTDGTVHLRVDEARRVSASKPEPDVVPRRTRDLHEAQREDVAEHLPVHYALTRLPPRHRVPVEQRVADLVVAVVLKLLENAKHEPLPLGKLREERRIIETELVEVRSVTRGNLVELAQIIDHEVVHLEGLTHVQHGSFRIVQPEYRSFILQYIFLLIFTFLTYFVKI